MLSEDINYVLTTFKLNGAETVPLSLLISMVYFPVSSFSVSVQRKRVDEKFLMSHCDKKEAKLMQFYERNGNKG